MNKHYLEAVGSVASLIKKGEGLWAQLVRFSHEMRTNDTPCKDGEAMKASFLTEEKAASKEQKVDMGKNSTYRVIKGILVKAAEYNVELMDAKGKPRGKTDIERELADLVPKNTKTPLEKLQASIAAASKQVDEIEDTDLAAATACVEVLYKELGALLLALPKVGS